MHQKTRVLSAKKVREIAQNNNNNTNSSETKIKNSIKGYCRIRKLLPNEVSINPIECIKPLDSTTINILDYSEISGGKSTKGQTFTFNGVFDKESNNEKLYNEMFKGVVSPVLESVKDLCLISKGVTNSGKTYSMIGEGEKDPGMLIRCLNELFFLRDKKEIGSIKITVTFIEIYNEIIRDLLDEGKSKSLSINVKEDLNRGTILENANEIEITSLKDAYKLVLKGNSNRMSESKSQTISKENLNSILTIHLVNNIQNKQSGNIETKYSKFVFVELAGSETLMTNKKADKNSSKSIVCLFRCLEMLNELSLGSSNVKKLFPWREAILSR